MSSLNETLRAAPSFMGAADVDILDLSDALLDLLPAAVYVCDADGAIVRFNRRAAELWGRSPVLGDPAERYCGSHRLFRLDGGPLPHSACPMVDVLRIGAPVRAQEVMIEQPDGSRVIALVNIDPIKGRAGNVVGAINCFQDITDRKRTEVELRASREDLEDFFENSVVPMNWLGPDGTILRANRAELDLLGYTREDYVGRHIAEFHADRAVIDDILDRLSRGDKLDQFPARLRARDGAIKHVLISSSARFRNGKFVSARSVTLDMTAYRLSQAALRESERRSRELIAALPGAVYTTDADGRITFYNDAAAELWGHRPPLGTSEWCGSWRLYWPDGTPMPHDQCPMAVALKERRAVRGAEAVAERPDGTRVPFIPYPTPLFDASGALNGAVNMLVDISDRHRQEAELRAKEERLRALIEASSQIVWTTDANGQVVEDSLSWRAFTGQTYDQLKGLGWLDAIHPEDRERVLALWQDAVAAKSKIKFEYRVRHVSGEWRWTLTSACPVVDRDGAVREWIGMNIDITDRKRDELAAQRLAAIVESSDDAIVSKDLNGIIRSWNVAAQRLFGYRPDEVIGKSVTILIPPDRYNEEPEILARIRRGERIGHYETVRIRRDGSLVDISLTVSPIKDTHGKVVGASKIARDVSERNRSQARQQLLVQEIQHRTKNLFAVVQAVVSRSFAGKQTVKEAKATVLSRLTSLAQTHVMLMDSKWEGAEIGEAVAAEMGPFGGRVKIDGPKVMLKPKVAQNFGLALHELATNAAKYGALSNSSGWVEVSWSIGALNGSGVFSFRWQERGGPPVQAPERKGFGSTVLEFVMGEYFGELPRIDFDPAGVSYVLEVPLETIVSPDRKTG